MPPMLWPTSTTGPAARSISTCRFSEKSVRSCFRMRYAGVESPAVREQQHGCPRHALGLHVECAASAASNALARAAGDRLLPCDMTAARCAAQALTTTMLLSPFLWAQSTSRGAGTRESSSPRPGSSARRKAGKQSQKQHQHNEHDAPVPEQKGDAAHKRGCWAKPILRCGVVRRAKPSRFCGNPTPASNIGNYEARACHPVEIHLQRNTSCTDTSC